MFVTAGVYTRKVASEVGSTIKYLMEHPDDDRFFELQLVRYPGSGREDWTEMIRLVAPDEGRVITLADKSEVVRCVTREGRHIDIIFGDVTERELQPALVLLEGEA